MSPRFARNASCFKRVPRTMRMSCGLQMLTLILIHACSIHNGPTKIPQEESDPRTYMEPNFYFHQEDTLSKWIQTKPKETSYTIAMPSYILGAVPNAAMNAAYPLAVYCAVSKYLNEPLVFPSGYEAWVNPQVQSTAKMNAYLEEWLALGLPESETARETGVGKGGGGKGKPFAREEGQGKFNAFDQSPWAWESAWPRVADWYGLQYKGPDLSEGAKYHETSAGTGPRGYGTARTSQTKFRTVDWAKEERVQNAWKEIAKEHNLYEKELSEPERVFGFLDGWVNLVFPLQFR